MSQVGIAADCGESIIKETASSPVQPRLVLAIILPNPR